MNRRKFIKAGVGAGLLAGAGAFGAYEVLPPSRSRNLESVDAIAGRFYASLDAEQQIETCVDYDSPWRQYHNRGVWGGGRRVLLGFSRAQRSMLTDLLYAGLSSEGGARIPEEYFTRLPGVHTMSVLVCGSPADPPYQVILTGAHVNLRIGGKSREGAAFGGPQVYGDQRGDGQDGLPGNLYRQQFVIAQQIYRGMDDGQRRIALVDEAPKQTSIELQGKRGSFSGIPVQELSAEGKTQARQLVEQILSTYPDGDVAFARECLEANGGVEALSMSFYRHHDEGDVPEAQVFRLEGPGAVFHFRGHPHVHAFVNIAMDGDAPLSVGEPLGTNPAWLDRQGVVNLFETALESESGADLAYFNEGSVAGRLHPGVVRSGDIYTLESWQEYSEVVDVRGSDLSSGMIAALKKRNQELEPQRIYRVATSAFVASDLSDHVGRIGSRSRGPLLRDLTISHLRKHGFTQL